MTKKERKIMENKELALAMKNEVAIASASAMAIAEIRSSMQLAKMYPRDNNQARVDILDTCRRPGFAPHVCYGKPIGTKIIKGISIRGAEVAANYWGNIKSMSGIVFDDESKRIINVVSMDLQTNTSYSSQVVVEKIIERKFIKKGQVKIYERQNAKGETVYGITPTADEFEVKVASQISKQIRNNILRLIPEDIKEEMEVVAGETMANQAAQDPFGEIKKIVDAFASLRVMPKDLSDFLGHDVGKCSPTQVAELRVMYKSIKDGEAIWSDYLPEIVQGDKPEEKEQTKTDKLKKDLSKKLQKETPQEDQSTVTPGPPKTELARLNGLIEEIKIQGVDLDSLCKWFKACSAKSEAERIAEADAVLELLVGGVPWSTISRQGGEPAKAEEPKEEKKAAWMDKPKDDNEAEVRQFVNDQWSGLMAAQKTQVFPLVKVGFPTLKRVDLDNQESLNFEVIQRMGELIASLPGE